MPKLKHQNNIRTKNNHFRYQDRGGHFVPSYGVCHRAVLDFHSEALIAAKEIRRTFAGKKLALFLSGGIDSEIMARAFYEAKIPFKARILRMAKNKNKHDWSWAVKWCKAHHVAYEFYDLDPIEFVQSGEYLKYADEAECSLFTIIHMIKMMEDVAALGEIPIMGSGDCYLEYNKSKRWVMPERRKFASFHRYADKKKFAAVPSFFQWSPELMASFLLDPVILNVVLSSKPKRHYTNPLKQEFYASHFPGLKKRPKYIGYEKLPSLEKKALRTLEKRHPEDLQEVLQPYGTLIRKLKAKPKK